MKNKRLERAISRQEGRLKGMDKTHKNYGKICRRIERLKNPLKDDNDFIVSTSNGSVECKRGDTLTMIGGVITKDN